MSARGHDVEVFAASPSRDAVAEEQGLLVHRLRETEPERFRQAVGSAFARRHSESPFEVVEGPEFGADALEAVRSVPEIPLVVKLHTPTVFVSRTSHGKPSWIRRIAAGRSAWLRSLPETGRPDSSSDADAAEVRSSVARADSANSIERAHALDADEIAAPSKSIGRAVRRLWDLPAELVHLVPYPFAATEALLRIPAGGRGEVVSFIGRLEPRKGVLELSEAIPLVLARCPDARFRFVGPSNDWPRSGHSMRDFLAERLSSVADRVEFTGEVEPERIPEVLSTTDICVFPRRWENFPNVCLEAMAAARAIVASSAGGMYEMLDEGRCAELVVPGNVRRLAGSITRLLRDPDRRRTLGLRARARVSSEYGADRVGGLMEMSYRRAIDRRRRVGPRPRSAPPDAIKSRG